MCVRERERYRETDIGLIILPGMSANGGVYDCYSAFERSEICTGAGTKGAEGP